MPALGFAFCPPRARAGPVDEMPYVSTPTIILRYQGHAAADSDTGDVGEHGGWKGLEIGALSIDRQRRPTSFNVGGGVLRKCAAKDLNLRPAD